MKRSRIPVGLAALALLLGGAQPARAQDAPIHYWNPSWSPDGSKIVFESNLDGDRTLDLYLIDADGANLTRIRDDAQNPSFSPDGSKIVFISDEDGDLEIYLMDADGANPVQLTDNDEAVDYGPAFSLDGAKIMYNSRPGPKGYDHDLYLMNADGSNPVRLTDQTTNDLSPAWSPDGARIAFISERDGQAGLYVMNAVGANPTRLTPAPAGEE